MLVEVLLVGTQSLLPLALVVCLSLLVVAVEAELVEVELVPLLDLGLVDLQSGLCKSCCLQNCLKIEECVGNELVKMDFVQQFQGNCSNKCS